MDGGSRVWLLLGRLVSKLKGWLSVQGRTINDFSAALFCHFMSYLLDSLFNSFNSRRSFLFSSCSLGVKSGVMYILRISGGFVELRSLVQFRKIAAFSDSVETVIFSNLGFSRCWPILIALVMVVVMLNCYWKIEETVWISCCFLVGPSSDVDSSTLWTIEFTD